MGIKIPNSVETHLLLHACKNILDSDGFINAEDDSGGVEQGEHDNGEDKDHGVTGIKLLMTQSQLHIIGYKAFNNIFAKA